MAEINTFVQVADKLNTLAMPECRFIFCTSCHPARRLTVNIHAPSQGFSLLSGFCGIIIKSFIDLHPIHTSRVFSDVNEVNKN